MKIKVHFLNIFILQKSNYFFINTEEINALELKNNVSNYSIVAEVDQKQDDNLKIESAITLNEVLVEDKGTIFL
jgi:hypothetical protein